jgi:hypothetical protein
MRDTIGRAVPLALLLALGCGGEGDDPQKGGTSGSTGGTGGGGSGDTGTGGTGGADSGGAGAGGSAVAGSSSTGGSPQGGSGQAGGAGGFGALLGELEEVAAELCSRINAKCPAYAIEDCKESFDVAIGAALAAECGAELLEMYTCGKGVSDDAIECFGDGGSFAPGTCQAELDTYNECENR